MRGFRTHHEDHCKKACDTIRNCKCWNYIHRSHGKISGFCHIVTIRKTIQKIYFDHNMKIISGCKNTRPRRWKIFSVLFNQCAWHSLTQFFSLRAAFSKVFSLYFSFFKLFKVLLPIFKEITEFYKMLNRYRRGLETCPQAKRFKSERSATTLFTSIIYNASERGVWLSA